MNSQQLNADFSPIAERYDETRNLPNDILNDCYNELEKSQILSRNFSILDAGCGTGQLSIPLIERGYQVTGVDLSDSMLQIASAKCIGQNKAEFIVADVSSLPFKDDSFHMVVVSKLFQHVTKWRNAIDELVRVLKPGGFIILIQDKGAFGNTVRKKFAHFCDNEGFIDRYYGAKSPTEIHEYLINFSTYEQLKTVYAWNKEITFGQALQEIKDRLFAEFWNIPDTDYEKLIFQLENWVNDLPEKRDTKETLQCKLVVGCYRVH
ncbi:Methyltransferase domain-containing protein [Gracilibacillus ureilyticus]|uniref:Methyltransferase domain-containing protein n=1 Tax=Gracilibacillus ureilyticus TaxID=531814 RepID=A0A1H9TW10_9BACI|nr:class I SAM-dependent methyltransferase [Gracilibacillus ureilyticus]SES01188.1 Methyltransferase domain-containing protein [Gracilibacillus ureilyticus]